MCNIDTIISQKKDLLPNITRIIIMHNKKSLLVFLFSEINNSITITDIWFFTLYHRIVKNVTLL